jgi:SAM-dependent methyltransferase
VKLNLGANDRRVEGFVSVDITPPADQIADLSKPWPWPDSSVEEVLAYSIFEHLPNKIHTMQELWRILRPGGIARIQLPHATLGNGGHCDPTHCSYWTPSDFEYYVPGIAEYDRFHAGFAHVFGSWPAFRVLKLDKCGHIPIKVYQRRFGGVVVEFDVVLEAIK